MLYITTRNEKDTNTAYKALTEDFAPDGGRYLPFYFLPYSFEEVATLKEKSFNETMADILNLFFSSGLTGWDLDFCIGKRLTRTISMNHRIVVSELWHNLGGSFSHLERALYNKIMNNEKGSAEPTDWACIAVRIAALFGLYGEIMRADVLVAGQFFDISVLNDDLRTVSAATYARKMGLPVNMVICACEESSNIWDFIHRGVLNTSSLSNGMSYGLERLIQAVYGVTEADRFCKAYQNKQLFSLNVEALPLLNNNLFCTVAGKDRAKNTINSVYRSNSYIMDSSTALCYSGLQDYRAKTGDSGLTLILAETTPLGSAQEISNATGISLEKINNYINIS